MDVLLCIRVSTGGLTMNKFVKITSTHVAQIFNFHPCNELVAVGTDADLLV